MRALVIAIVLAVAPSGAQTIRATAQEGLPAPDFRITPVNGPSLKLSEMVQPNGAVVAFADPRSREGQRLLVYLQQSQQRLVDMKVGLVVFALGYGIRESVDELAKANNITVPLAWDENRRQSREYGVQTGAVAVVVDPERVIFRRYDATEQQLDIGPLAMGGVRDLMEKLTAAAAQQPTPADNQPAAPPISDHEARQRIRAGWQLIQQGHTATALEDARTLATQCGPGDLLSTLWLAYTLEAARQYPESAVTYRKVLKIKPGHAYALEAIARIDPQGKWQSEADLAPPADQSDEAPAPTE